MTEEKVCTIGKFNGVHKGHESILKAAVSFARKKGLKTLCVTFKNSADEFIRHPRLKIEILKSKGIDEVKILNFTDKLKNTSKNEFINFLKKQKVKYIFCGKDFKFGRGASGTAEDLKKDFDVKSVDFKKTGGEKISSSRIKKLIRNGNVREAEKLLGFYLSASGYVLKGSRLGRRIETPTLNISLLKSVFYPGVYVAAAAINGKLYEGVSSAGPAPTVNRYKPLLETFVFEPLDQIYGEYVDVFLIKRIRSVKKFQNVPELQKQIKKDIQIAKKYFKENKKTISKKINLCYNKFLIRF